MSQTEESCSERAAIAQIIEKQRRDVVMIKDILFNVNGACSSPQTQAGAGTGTGGRHSKSKGVR